MSDALSEAPSDPSELVATTGTGAGSGLVRGSSGKGHPLRRPRGRTFVRMLEKLTTYSLEAVGRIQSGSKSSNIRVHRNIPYLSSGRRSHLLDVYIPEGRIGPLPIVFYVHGGAFMWCSKDTHFLFARRYAEQGFIVFNINYRLAPHNRYPAAIRDVCDALLWVNANAARFGGDPKRLVFAGESAGANLISGLTIACCSRREEPWARALFDAAITPRAVISACGILQVSNARRFSVRRKLPRVVRRILHLLPDAYVDLAASQHQGELDLVDPLLVMESDYRFDRPLPGFFLPVGTADPLLDDSRRMSEALTRRGVPAEARYYPGEIHAFHVMRWRPRARQCWRDTFRFIDTQLRAPRLVRVAG